MRRRDAGRAPGARADAAPTASLVAVVAIVTTMAVVVTAGGPAGCAAAPERREFRELHMGCEARVVVYAADAERARLAARRAFDRIAELDRVLSDWSAASEVSRLAELAADGGGPFPVSPDLDAVLECALRVWRATDGRFDPALGARTRLWRRVRADGAVPSQAALDAAQRASGADAVSLGPGGVTFSRAGVRLDFGAIGKGWAADEALRVLVRDGVPASLVDVGGDLAAGDAPPGARSWRVRIAATGASIDVPPWSGLATSGDREQWIDVDGAHASHVLDPAGGLGVVGAPEITVLVTRPREANDSCGAAALADALATALTVAPAHERAFLLGRFPGATLSAPR